MSENEKTTVIKKVTKHVPEKERITQEFTKDKYEKIQVEVLRNMVHTFYSQAIASLNDQQKIDFMKTYGNADKVRVWSKKKCIWWLSKFNIQLTN